MIKAVNELEHGPDTRGQGLEAALDGDGPKTRNAAQCREGIYKDRVSPHKSSRLGPPLAAISSARLTDSCPFTPAKSISSSGARSKMRATSRATGRA